MAVSALTTLAFSAFSLINDQNVPADVRHNLTSFTLSTRPITDIWRKPRIAGFPNPLIDDLNAPCFIGKVPLAGFVSASVTLNATWNRLYDQGGLVFIFPAPAPESSAKRQWIKTGIEMFNDIPNVATVAASATSTADWSLVPLAKEETSATIELSREPVNATDGKGSSLFIYWIQKDGTKILIRETTWVFENEFGEVEIGAYVARPIRLEDAGNPSEVLTVTFSDLKVQYENIPPVTAAPTPNNGAAIQVSSALATAAVLLAI
ncbi:hypothetical protein BV898_00301 [Hypsibius exemplaris]|uniref:Uncharacterized protein n=1 Tax=Hypsibius exemplaris TaxID=2072580 RepID=A0A1W0XFP8_HYPEX|nr:hypothetical protein BV898_00301 [Hypsibius exemplaris]